MGTAWQFSVYPEYLYEVAWQTRLGLAGNGKQENKGKCDLATAVT